MRSLSECKVMIVDDTESNIDLLVETLSNDYSICVALDGGSALEYAAKYLPDIILLDVMMPGMDGYEVIERLKADPVTEGIPVIFCTVMSKCENEMKGLELGFRRGDVKSTTLTVQPGRLAAYTESGRKSHSSFLFGSLP